MWQTPLREDQTVRELLALYLAFTIAYLCVNKQFIEAALLVPPTLYVLIECVTDLLSFIDKEY